jgi:putative addiction module component (TIGR02574 family)
MERDPAVFLKEALALPPETRAALAASLLESLVEEVDEGAETAWRTEIEGRMAELDSGEVKTVPWPDVCRRLGQHRSAEPLDVRGGLLEIVFMASQQFDFSHLTADERIELAERLWDSLPADAIGPDEAQVLELQRRRAALEADGAPGRPWSEVLDEIERNGA